MLHTQTWLILVCPMKRPRQLLMLLASVALVVSACSKATNTNTTNTSSTTSNNTATSANTATAPVTPAPPTTTNSGLSPAAVYRAFQEANRKKDYEGVKKYLSKGTLALLVDEAKKKNQTLDEHIKDRVDGGSNDEEVSNEKINGESATVDVDDGGDSNSKLTIPMVREDGEWKIAYDVFLKQLKEAFNEMSKEAPKTMGNDNSKGNGDK